MKYFIGILIGCCCLMASSNAMAQRNVGPLMLDPSFANNGTSEIDFEGANNDATCFVAFKYVPGFLNRILVGGKIYTSTPGEIRFGVAEYDSIGTLESGFGTNGKADLSWNGIDYPNAIDLLPDGSVLAAGESYRGPLYNAPSFFRLKANGTPDSSFGSNGRVVLTAPAMGGGEFEDLDTLPVGVGDTSARFVAMGYAIDLGIPYEGFYAVHMDSVGVPDTRAGGQTFVQAQITTAQGHLIDGGGILFAGLGSEQYPEIILCKLLPNGIPDPSFGTGGVLNTGIALHGGDQIQSAYDSYISPSDPSPGLLVAAPVADSSAMLPFTIIKFKLDGTLDPNFGKNGLATAPIISNMKVYGLTVHANNGNAHISGSIGNVSAAIQFLYNGVIDSTFGTNGIALLDADGGLHKNFLIGFETASLLQSQNGSKQRFIGVGTSVNAAGNDEFLLARYMPGVAGVSTATTEISRPLQIYPNPAHGFVTVETPSGAIERITIVDALGRIVKSFERPGFAPNSNSYYLDVSEIPNGAYNCTVRTASGISAQRFTVIH